MVKEAKKLKYWHQPILTQVLTVMKIVMEKITHFHVNPGPLSRWQLKERIVSNIVNFLECQMFFQELESVCLLEKKNLGGRIIKGSSSQMLKALAEPASAPESRCS